MSYTIADLDTAVEDTGWDYPYTPYTGPGKPKAEERIEHTQGWHEFFEATDNLFTYPQNDDGSYKRDGDGKTVRELVKTPGFALPGIGQAVLVDIFGGEGQGDQYWFVFKIIETDGTERLFRRNGWYASYSGGEYDGPTEEVAPQETTVTVYVLKDSK